MLELKCLGNVHEDDGAEEAQWKTKGDDSANKGLAGVSKTVDIRPKMASTMITDIAVTMLNHYNDTDADSLRALLQAALCSEVARQDRGCARACCACTTKHAWR